jgi:hypothetical protein
MTDWPSRGIIHQYWLSLVAINNNCLGEPTDHRRTRRLCWARWTKRTTSRQVLLLGRYWRRVKRATNRLPRMGREWWVKISLSLFQVLLRGRFRIKPSNRMKAKSSLGQGSMIWPRLWRNWDLGEGTRVFYRRRLRNLRDLSSLSRSRGRRLES